MKEKNTPKIASVPGGEGGAPPAGKRGSPGIRLLTALIFLAVAGYFGIQIYSALANPMICAVAYRYQTEDTLSVTGFVVRDEETLGDSGGGLLRLTRSEGERVSAGGTVAQIYADQASLDRQTEIDRLRTQLDQLNYAAEAASAGGAALQLDGLISEALLSVRRSVAADRLDTAADAAAELEALTLRREYTYTDAAELKAQAEELKSQLSALTAQSAGRSRTVAAPRSGLYSAVADGYESVLTPDMLDTLTPSALAAVRPAEGAGDLGKLVLGDAWYFAASLSAADAERLSVGSAQTLRFAKGVDRDLRVTVQSVSAAENGRCVAVFRGTAYLAQLTLLRAQTADVVFSAISGIRVPQQAIRVDESGAPGVYCVVGAEARFKPVRLLWSSDDGYALVEAEGTGAAILRPGDQVILSAGGLTDGAVVSYAG